MENLTYNNKGQNLLGKTTRTIVESSYRGFASIDQEMVREIAMNFFKPVKKTLRSHKGFVFIKDWYLFFQTQIYHSIIEEYLYI